MSAEAAFTRSWSVGCRTCTLTAARPAPGAVAHCVIEWTPTMPVRLVDAEIEAYRRGRDTALADLARELGLRVAIVEV